MVVNLRRHCLYTCLSNLDSIDNAIENFITTSYDLLLRGGGAWGRDESERQRAESQRIVAARPLCRLQYPVAYLSVCKGFYPPLDGNCTSRRPARLIRRDGSANDTCPWGARAPTAGRQADGGRMRHY
ncbi:FBD-associated F-box protein [Dorcoceras hygrometricum]|uniref:FBD-associated F-box protein n=1 Tax=Dorcoceras hygrometricum TaxID=472368 RepID=A0A2Z6ZRI4_9LAMI|nr:FBD-associated F-box protein [Dorcoceras hygrometricum]